MSDQPLISVCIPTYNRSKELSEAIYSITIQLDDKLEDKVEIIITDDVGTDDTPQVIANLQKQYNNIRYIRNDKNYRFGNGIIANSHATGEYMIMLSDDDYLTEFSLSYLVEIIEKTGFDFLLHKPVYTPDINIVVPKTPNSYSVYDGVKEYINALYAREKKYMGLIGYFSFNSIMVVKSSYRKESYSLVDKEVMMDNEFPQEFPPYFDLKDKIIVLTDSTFVKGRLLNAQYFGSLKLINDFKITMNFIEKQNSLESLPAWKAIKRICITGWTRTMYIGIVISKLHLNYKQTGLIRKIYFFFKKFVQ